MSEFLRFLSSAQSVFRVMEVAEDEIDRALIASAPERREVIYNAFAILTPPRRMSEYAEMVYRAHCRELLGRLMQPCTPANFSVPTWAELVVAISEVSMATPVTDDGGALYAYIIRQVINVLGDDAPSTWKDALEELEKNATPSWPTFAEEEAERLRRQLTDRKIPDPAPIPAERLEKLGLSTTPVTSTPAAIQLSLL